MADVKTIRQRFEVDDAARQGGLDQARAAAALTKPHLLPPKGLGQDDELPKNYQSVGSRGMSILTGRMMLAIWPAGINWFSFVPSAKIRFDPDIPVEVIQEMQKSLFLHAQRLSSQLETTDLSPDADLRRRVQGFRTHKVRMIEQILITGETLELLHEDWRMQGFRRDHYVNKRDSSGTLLYHITRERKDVGELSEEMFRRTELPGEILDPADAGKRLQDLYTWIQWNPFSRLWVIEQEINGHVINRSEERISPYICTAFELTGENYGRGFIEAQNMGDLRSLDELELHRLDMMALAAKQLTGVDLSSSARDEDLRKPPGGIVRNVRVVNGVVQDVGPMSFSNIRDFQMLTQGVVEKTQNLGKSMLIEGETTRRAERVTTVEINRNVAELQEALGGVYASVADEQQIPLLQRMIHQWNLQNGADPFRNPETNESTIEMRSVTGLAALAQGRDTDKLLQVLQVITQMGPEAASRIDMGVAINVLLQKVGLHQPGLIKTDEMLRQEQERAMQDQVVAAAGAQAVSSAGKIAETTAQQEAA
jgi:hypothetical protein